MPNSLQTEGLEWRSPLSISPQLFTSPRCPAFRKGFFFKRNTVSSPNPRVSHPQILPRHWRIRPMDVRLVESANAKPGDKYGRLYSLYFALLYKGLEQPRILISAGAPGTSSPPPPTPADSKGDCNCASLRSWFLPNPTQHRNEPPGHFLPALLVTSVADFWSQQVGFHDP